MPAGFHRFDIVWVPLADAATMAWHRVVRRDRKLLPARR
jgi:hypothetical protein